MRQATVVASVLAGLGLVGLPPGPAAAQSHVIVPIVIRTQRAASPPPARTPSIHVTTRTTSPQPGMTTTSVTVVDTTGAGRIVGLSPATRTMMTVPAGTPSVRITVDRRLGPDGTGVAGQTRVTVEDVSQSNRVVGGPAPVSILRAARPGQQTLIITSEAPIDAPIVILAP
jgi:hypothetical protein